MEQPVLFRHLVGLGYIALVGWAFFKKGAFQAKYSSWERAES